MTSTAFPSSHPGDPLALIEASPLSAAAWERLAEKARGQNDPLSIKSLDIIINGLRKIEEQKIRAEQKGASPPQLSSLSKLMFTRLAKAYNSPTLLKEAGLIYLRDLSLPDVALQHFERALRLGGPEKELRPLTEAAAVAVQRQLSINSGQEPAYSGIMTAQHSKPLAKTIIRKTGKVLLPSHFTKSGRPGITSPLESESLSRAPLPSTTAECLEESGVALQKGQLKRAELLLREANKAPGSRSVMWQGWTNLGQSCYEAAQYPQMETAFIEAMRYDPNEMASHFNIALGQHLNQKYERALTSYLRANQIEPNHPKVWCNLGVLYFQMDHYPDSESALLHATQADAGYARAWDNLAAALGAQDKLDEAIAACERAIELRPDYSEAFFKLGVIFFSRNDLTRAEAEFQRAERLPILTPYTDAFQAMIHARREQPELAEAAVLRAARADPKCDMLWMAWNELGLAWYTAGNYPRGAAAYGEATMIKPDEPEAWFNLGVSYHQAGDLKAARNAYQHAVDLRGSLGNAWNNLGIVCALEGDHQAAMTAFRQGIHWEPGNMRAWYDLGVTLDKLGQADEAQFAYARADELGFRPDPVPVTDAEE